MGEKDRREQSHHPHRLPPKDVIAIAIRVTPGSHSMEPAALAEVALNALRASGYTLMRPVCEICEDDGVAW